MGNHAFILSAEWVFPVCAPAIHFGAVAVTGGKIAAVGPRDDIIRNFPGMREERIVSAALLPGFVNAHTHLELGYLRNKIPPGHFVDWVVRLIKLTGQVRDTAATVSQSVREGIVEGLQFGVTTLGDISREMQLSRPVAADGPARMISFGEILALGQNRGLLGERLALAANERNNSLTLKAGLSPHAPYTVEGPALKKITAAARALRLPVCMHLAELKEENDFLRDQSGRIREVWESVGIAAKLLDNQIPCFAGGPIRWAQEWGLLELAKNNPVLLAHVNYADDEELNLLAESGAHVAYCPRTRTYFGHDLHAPHPLMKMLVRGINVCLATDSLASNPDLSVLREAAHVARMFPDVPHATLLEMITTRPALALGMASKVGALAPEMSADLIALPVHHAEDADEALATIIQDAPTASRVWIEGKVIIS